MSQLPFAENYKFAYKTDAVVFVKITIYWANFYTHFVIGAFHQNASTEFENKQDKWKSNVSVKVVKNCN